MIWKNWDRRVRAAMFATSAICAVYSVQAQAQQAQTGNDNTGIQDIIVTAQKREQSLQDVPISVSAVSLETLQSNRITSVMDLATFVPNLTIRPVVGGQNTPLTTLRGLLVFATAPGQDRSIPIYQDGVYLGAAAGLSFELPDLERLEVLRGPQGTLFGRNATGGAISIITREPSGEFGLRQELSYGNYQQFRSVTRVELPQIGPFSASFSYTHNERNGDIKNLGAGTVWDRSAVGLGKQVSPRTLGDRNVEGVFAAVKFEPSDSFKTVYKFDWMENHFTPEGTGVVAFTPQALGPFLGPILQANYDANPFPISGAHRPKYVNNSFSAPGYQKVYGHNVTSTLQVSDSLSFRNVFGYRRSIVTSYSEIFGAGGLLNTSALLGPVGSPYLINGLQVQGKTTQTSDELQANYDSSFLTLTAGGVYFESHSSLGGPPGLRNSIVLSVVPNYVIPQVLNDQSVADVKSWAGYAQAEVHVLPTVDIVGGYRITRDKKLVISRGLTSPYKKSRPSYLIGVNYKPNPDILLFAKYSTGFVSGGSYNTIEYNAETVKSWEAGFKGDLLNNMLRFNLSLFQAKYRNLQGLAQGENIGREDLRGTPVLVSTGTLKATGFEAELTVAPARGLTINGGLGYTDTKLSNINPILLLPIASNPAASFNLYYRPKWTGSVSAIYETEPLFGDARLMLRADGTWRARHLTAQYLPLPAAYQSVQNSPAHWMVNARASLRNIKLDAATVEVSAWVRNLTDFDGTNQPLVFGTLNPSLAAAAFEPARTFGVDLVFTY